MAELPLLKFNFLVEWGGASVAFTEVTGLEYRTGDSTVAYKTKMPGMLSFGNITLKRGTIGIDSDFYTWFNSSLFNKAEPRTLTIKLLNEELNPIMTWRAMNCFVIKYTPSELKSDANEVAVEAIEIATEYLSLMDT